MEGSTPKIVENSEGKRTIPSIVSFNPSDNSILVGEAAKRQSSINRENTFYGTKRLIGRKFKDPDVIKDVSHLSYKVTEHENGDAWLQLSDGQTYSPSQVGGFVLQHMKHIAETYLDCKVKNAVVTVPAYFNDSQRQATKTAGELFGMNVMRVINEPTAAALAYGLGNKNDGIIAVYDLGGGTFDVSILDIEDGVFEVVSTNGDTHLGGEDFDNVLLRYIKERFEKEENVKLTGNLEAMQRLRQAAEVAKINLTHHSSTQVDLPFITGDKNLSMEISEQQLDEMSMPLIERTIERFKKAVKDSDINKDQIDEILLVGGMTRMPRIRKELGKFFGKPANASINPDEAVALGAAIQGAVLSGEVKDVLLLDVNPLTLGIETYGGIFSPLIPRNTTIPCKVTQMYSTAVDGQNSIEVNVYQGERTLVSDNKLIGNFKLGGIPPQPKGTPQVEVAFDIDADGIIKVGATDKKSNKRASITVFGSTGLSSEEVESIVQSSAEQSEEDQLKRSVFDKCRNVELVCFDCEQALAGYSEQIKDDDKRRLSDEIEKLRRTIQRVRKFEVDAKVLDQANIDLQKLVVEAVKR